MYQYILVIIILLSLVACSSRSTPAPVVDIGGGKVVVNKTKKSISSDTYIVAKGDTLFSIAWYSNKDFKELARINNIPAPYRIYPDQTILLKERVKKQPQTLISQKKASNRTKTNITVDREKKQAYGKNSVVAKNSTTASGNTGKWQWPSSGAVISRFSLTEKGNKGIDIAGRLGSPILAAADGKVVYTGNALRGYGNLVIVKHDEDYLSAYAHNDEILVKEEQRVQTGQTIARMGNSGAQRTKLHFEVRYKGKSVDPLRYLPKHNNNK